MAYMAYMAYMAQNDFFLAANEQELSHDTVAAIKSDHFQSKKSGTKFPPEENISSCWFHQLSWKDSELFSMDLVNYYFSPCFPPSLPPSTYSPTQLSPFPFSKQ